MSILEAEKAETAFTPACSTPSHCSATPSYHDNDTSGESILSPPPDGGRQAWLVVLGTCLAFFSSWGITNSYGAFQAFYSSSLLKTSPSSTISLIGSMQLFLVYGLGPIIGKIVDAHGARVVIPLGSILVVLSLILLSFCQQDQLYQVFLTHGVLFGVGSALLFTSSFTCIGQHFTSRRAYAMSIAGASSSLGGILYPIVLQRLIAKIGFAWAVRAMALTTLPCLLISCLTIKTWFPPSGDTTFKNAIDLRGFKDMKYTLATIGSFLVFLVLFIPFFFINTYGFSHNVPSDISAYLVTIINAFTIPARIFPGLLADWLGILPILIPCIILTAISVLAMWTFSTTSASIVAFACLYGLFSGSFTVLLPPYIAQIVPRENFGARLGSVYIGAAIASLIGPTVAGSFFHDAAHITQAEFNRLIVFTGVSMLGGGAFFVGAHVVGLRQKKREAAAR